MPAVSLNIDLGELPSEPEELYATATVVNIACGGHAGDAGSMARAIELALAGGARIAVHPSYPDRAGFGRKTMTMEKSALRESIARQCAELQDIARRVGHSIGLVKPHGALYHDAAAARHTAEAVLEGAVEGLGMQAIELVGPPEGMLRQVAEERGLAYTAEGFADRGYQPDGRLVPRGQPGALITDPALAAEQAVRLARSGRIATLCVHADTPGALAIARAVRRALAEGGLLAGPS